MALISSFQFWLSISVLAFGIGVVLCAFFFGRRLYWPCSPPVHPEEYLEKRNRFWELFGQVALSVVVAALLTVLLLTKTIEADAGLPILSAIVAFVVGKGVGGTARSTESTE